MSAFSNLMAVLNYALKSGLNTKMVSQLLAEDFNDSLSIAVLPFPIYHQILERNHQDQVPCADQDNNEANCSSLR